MQIHCGFICLKSLISELERCLEKSNLPSSSWILYANFVTPLDLYSQKVLLIADFTNYTPYFSWVLVACLHVVKGFYFTKGKDSAIIHFHCLPWSPRNFDVVELTSVSFLLKKVSSGYIYCLPVNFPNTFEPHKLEVLFKCIVVIYRGFLKTVSFSKYFWT